MSSLFIVGAGGHGKAVADIAESTGRYSEIFFLDDSAKAVAAGPLGYSIAGDLSRVGLLADVDADVVVAIGNARARRDVSDLLREAGCRIVSLVHPSATVSRHAAMGKGTVVMPGAVIGPDSRVGDGVIVNTAASIDHDCVVDDYAHVSVGGHLAGTVRIGRETWIGVGASVINNLTICPGCMIGAGAVVVNDIEEPGTYIGVPAKRMS